jgi:hypothetical protein
VAWSLLLVLKTPFLIVRGYIKVVRQRREYGCSTRALREVRPGDCTGATSIHPCLSCPAHFYSALFCKSSCVVFLPHGTMVLLN